MPHDDYHDHLTAAIIRAEDRREVVGDRVRVWVRDEPIDEFSLKRANPRRRLSMSDSRMILCNEIADDVV
jgi:hypothetical protein